MVLSDNGNAWCHTVQRAKLLRFTCKASAMSFPSLEDPMKIRGFMAVSNSVG